jgi:hypothetical protein
MPTEQREQKGLEYRICWATNTNVSFTGASEWKAWPDPGDDTAAIENALSDGAGSLGDGLEMALEASGFEWWSETREAGAADA